MYTSMCGPGSQQLRKAMCASLPVLAAALCNIAAAQNGSPSTTQGIYSCVDGAGRNITSDRPIAECTDRVQRQINPSGTVKRIVGPSLTAQERAALEEKEKASAELRAREAEEKRRDRALLARYPSRVVHDKERAEALGQVDEVIKASNKRMLELTAQRNAINNDLEFYKSDVAKAPASLKRRLEENDSSIAVQRRFITEQDAEKKRVTMRFEEELAKLKTLWTMAGSTVQTVPMSAPVRK